MSYKNIISLYYDNEDNIEISNKLFYVKKDEIIPKIYILYYDKSIYDRLCKIEKLTGEKSSILRHFLFLKKYEIGIDKRIGIIDKYYGKGEYFKI